MSTIKLEFPERLKQEKLFSPEQADAFARALNDELTDKLVTKSDLAELENKVLKWMVGLFLTGTVVNVTVVGLLVSL